MADETSSLFKPQGEEGEEPRYSYTVTPGSPRDDNDDSSKEPLLGNALGALSSMTTGVFSDGSPSDGKTKVFNPGRSSMNDREKKEKFGLLPSELTQSKFDAFESLCCTPSAATIKSRVFYDAVKAEHAQGKHFAPMHSRPIRWATFAAVGAVCGLVSFLLKQCVGWLFERRAGVIEELAGEEEGAGPWVLLLWGKLICACALLVTTSAAIIIFIEPFAAGSGIPETSVFLNGVIIPYTFSISVLLAKFASCALAVGSGLPCGPEGPMIHMGSVLGSIISQAQGFPPFLKEKLKIFRNIADRRDFMAAGVAGGVSAAFGAPIGGLLFVGEEIATQWDINLAMNIFLTSCVAVTIVEFLTSSFDGFEYIHPFGTILTSKSHVYEINKSVLVNMAMFVPCVMCGAVGGLFGALFNRIVLKGTDFRAKYIKPSKVLFLLEPACVALVYVSCVVFLPLAFECTRADCDGDSLKQGCSRVGLAKVDDVVAYGCAEGHYNPAATLLSPAGEKIVKQLFARGFHYQFDYAALACMLALYLPASAYCCGIACSTGIVVPCLLNGALIGRLFGLVVTDMAGGPPQDSASYWVDPGAFALLGAAGFFAGVSRLTVALTVIVTEISGDTAFILPVMVSVIVGKWVADWTGVHPIYHALMEKKALPYLGSHPHTEAPLQCFVAGQVMTKTVSVVGLKMPVPELARLLLEKKHHAFPATVPGPSGKGQQGQFIGLALREHLVGLLKMPDMWTDTSAVMQGFPRPDPKRDADMVPPPGLNLSDDDVQSYKRLFHFYDADGSGAIDRDELKQVLEKIGEKPTDERVDALIAEVDDSGDGEIDFGEFCQVMVSSSGKGGGFASVVSSLSADALSEQELLAFDNPEALNNAGFESYLRNLCEAPSNSKYSVDLKPYVDLSAFSVSETMRFDHAYNLFRAMGLRHMVVVDTLNCVAGIITRHNLLEKNLHHSMTDRMMKDPDEFVDYAVSF